MNRDNTALLIIDVVKGCCHPNYEDSENGITFTKIRNTVPKLDRFIGDYRNKINEHVIFVNLTPWTKEFLPENIQKLYENPAVDYYGEGGPEEEFYVVKPLATDTIITKNSYDAFTNPELEQYLQKNGVKNIITTGVFTDGCVLSTIVNGFSRGYNFVVLRDLVETTDLLIRQELARSLLEYTLPMQYGKVIESGEVYKIFS